MKVRLALAALVLAVPVSAQTTAPTTRSEPLRSALTYPENVCVVIDGKVETHDAHGKVVPVPQGDAEEFRLIFSRRSPDRLEILQAVPTRNRIAYDGKEAYVEIEGKPSRTWHPRSPTADRILETAGAMAAVNIDMMSVAKLLRSDAHEWLGSVDSLRAIPDVAEDGKSYARYTLSKAPFKSLELWVDRETGRLARVLAEALRGEASVKSDYRFSQWDLVTVIPDDRFEFRGDSVWGNALFDVPPSLKVGDVAPDFALPTLKKEQFTLSLHKGSPVVLYFWRVGSGEERIKTVHDMAAGASAECVLINRQNHAKDVRNAFAANKLTDFDTVMDHNSTAFVEYGSPSLPQAFVLNGSSVILYAGPLETDQDREAFAAALKEAAASKGRSPSTLPDI